VTRDGCCVVLAPTFIILVPATFAFLRSRLVLKKVPQLQKTPPLRGPL
jgi:hypothetical protein